MILLFLLLLNSSPPHYVHYSGTEEVKTLLFTRETPFHQTDSCHRKSICTQIVVSGNKITLDRGYIHHKLKKQTISLKPDTPPVQISEILRLKLLLHYKYALKQYRKQQEILAARREIKNLSGKIRTRLERQPAPPEEDLHHKKLQQLSLNTVKKLATRSPSTTVKQSTLEDLLSTIEELKKKMNQQPVVAPKIEKEVPPAPLPSPPRTREPHHLIQYALTVSNGVDFADLTGLTLGYHYRFSGDLFLIGELNFYTGNHQLDLDDSDAYFYDEDPLSMMILSLDLAIGQYFFRWGAFQVKGSLGLTTTYINLEHSFLSQEQLVTLRGTAFLQMLYHFPRNWGLSLTLGGSLSILEPDEWLTSPFYPYFDYQPGQFKVAIGGFFSF